MKMINSFHFIRASQFILLEMNRCATYIHRCVLLQRKKKHFFFLAKNIRDGYRRPAAKRKEQKIEEGLFAENIWHRSSPAYKVSRHIVVLARSSVPTTSDACRYIFFGVLLLLWMR